MKSPTEKRKIQTVLEENNLALLQSIYLFIVHQKCAIKRALFSYKTEYFIKHPITLETFKQIELPVLESKNLNLRKDH